LDGKWTQFPNHFFRVYHQIISKEEWLFICHLATYKYESKEGECRPSLVTIAQEMGYKDRRSAQKLKRSLIDKGYLEIIPQQGKPNVYDFAALSIKLMSLMPRTRVRPPRESQYALPVNPSTPLPVNPSTPEEEEYKKKREEENKEKASLFPELSLPPQTHTEDLRDRMGGATDPLDLAMVLEGKNGPRNSGRPCGWEDHSDAVFEVCRRIADLWRKGSLPTGTWGDEVEKWAAYASEFLAMHDGDLSKTLETITRYQEHYERENLTFTISGPKSLRNVLPAYLASGSKTKQKRGKRPVGIWTQEEIGAVQAAALEEEPIDVAKLLGKDA
jgi:hypothetical protein